MPSIFGAIVGGMMTGAVPTPLPLYGPPPPVLFVAQPSVINDGPFLHAEPEFTPGCSEYTVSPPHTNYGQVRGKPALSGRPLWRLITGSKVTICSKGINTDERNIPWIWVQFKSQEEQWDHEGYMGFRILEPFVTATPSPAPRQEPPQAPSQELSEARERLQSADRQMTWIDEKLLSPEQSDRYRSLRREIDKLSTDADKQAVSNLAAKVEKFIKQADAATALAKEIQAVITHAPFG